MELEEAKKTIIGYLASQANGQSTQSYLRFLMEQKFGYEMYQNALESLDREGYIQEDWMGSSRSWELTHKAVEEFHIYIKPYVDPDKIDPTTGMLRVVGSGGQTLDYISAPEKRDCCYMCCGFLIFIAIILFVALSLT